MSASTLPEGFDPFAGSQILSAVPSTEPQREVWTSSQIGDDANLAYNESVSVRLEGPLNADALAAALKDLIQRHEALRGTFSGDGITMLVNAAAEVPLEQLDLSSTSESQRASEVAALLERVVKTPFDLAKGPLARAHLVRLGPSSHQLVFTAHHIICDGWSCAVLMKDWGQLYSARAQGKAAALAPADPFSGYAASLTKKVHSQKLDADEAYWTNCFAGEVPVLELPTDRPRPPLKTYASRREDAVISEELVARLKKAGSKERVSLFAVLLSAFQALLSRLSNQNDVVVGIPVAGQTAEGHQELVGHAVSMLPIRAQLDPNKPAKALLLDMRTRILDAQEHQSFTIGSLLKKLPIRRDPSRLPLMSVIFNVDRGMGPSGLPFHGLTGSLSANARLFETYELFVNAVEYGGKITLECQYNSDLFDQATIQRWLAAYERLLRGLATDLEEGKGAALGRLPLLSDDELKKLDAWNAQSALEVDAKARVHDLFAAQAQKNPDGVAVRFEGRTLTYRALDGRANALAHKLRELGAKRGQRVGLAVERSPEMLVGLSGILKSGAAYVPLDPGYPRDRLTFMVQDGALDVIVSQRAVAEELKLESKHVVFVEDVTGEAAPLPASPDDAQPEDVCYVIYTSGSTGKPKGVQVPHRAVANILASVQRTPGLSPSDVVLAVTTLSFDIAVSELVLPLTVGATIELCSRDVSADGSKLLALLKSSKATFLDATPATYRLLLAAGWSGGDLKKCICTGEAMPRDLAIELVQRVPSVWNGYGPTETTVWSTFFEVKAPVEKILIGKPVANTQLYVLDPLQQRVPLGVVGELFIGGRGVTLGYHGRPELTSERFVKNPFGPGLMYRTGDLVRYGQDGNVECLGRNDNQVKIRGFRIELGEIEDQLTQHPAVKQAAVIVRAFKPDDLRLVAYVVTHAGQTVSDGDLRAHLKKTLPEYMVPAHQVRLDRMPLTPSGKIDRKALPAPDLNAGLQDAFVAPRTPTEKALAELWQQVLSVGRVGAADDFFALGGHSLLASQLLSRVQQKFGVALSFRKIFEAPTVEKLAGLVDAAKAAGNTAEVKAIPKRSSAETAPLSLPQERLWLLEQMDPGQRSVHNLPAAWRFKGPLDLGVFQKSLDALVARHESLRTNIRSANGATSQVMVATRAVPLELIDLSSKVGAEQDKAIEAELDELMGKDFDLASGPLLRLKMMKLGDQDHALLLAVHNIIWDGWSFDLFLKEMSEIYGALAQGKASPLPPLQVAYGDFSAWQRSFLGTPEASKQVQYWQKQLSGELAPIDFPTVRARQGSRSSAGGNEGILLSAQVEEALTALGQREGATLFAVLFAAFNVLLYRHSGQWDLVVGVPVRARTRPELENIIGPFTNNVLLRTRLDEGMTFVQLVRSLKNVMLDAFSNQDVPIEKLGIKPPMTRSYFSLQDARSRPKRFGTVDVAQFHAKPPSAGNEMMLWMMEAPVGLLAMLNYSADLFDSASMLRLLRQLETLLHEVLKDPNRKLSHLPILPEDERQLLQGFMRASAEGSGSLCDAVSDKAMGWARLCAQRGGREKLVAVKMAPSVERAAAVMGVLRAGGMLALEGDAPVVISDGDAPLPSGDVGPVPPPDAPALRAGATTVSHRALAQSVHALAERVGLSSKDVVFDGLDVSHPTWCFPALLAASAKATSLTLDAASATAVVAPSVALADLLATVSASAKVLCMGQSSRKLREGLAARAGPSFAVLIPDALGVPIASGPIAAADSTRAAFGKPLGNDSVQVLDVHRELLPINAPGQLYVGAVATNDKVRYLADGTLEHMGRLDGRVQFRGKLVATEVLARAIKAHPAVAEAAVRKLEDPEGDERLVAYVAAKAGEMFTETELRQEARKAGMAPQIFVELDALPKQSSGEIDEDRLPYPFARTGGQEFQAPRTEAEKVVAAVWQSALKLPRVSVYENFFDIGGYSLLVFQVLAELQTKTGVALSPRSMLLGTLEQVASELEAATKGTKPAATAPATSAPPPPAAEADRGLMGKLRGWTKR